MSTILRKIADFFGLKPPEQAVIERMIEMEEMEELEAQSNDMAAMPSEMEMVPAHSEERQTGMQRYDL